LYRNQSTFHLKKEGIAMPQKRIFISYRRSDSAGYAGRLYDYLKNYFGSGRIFFDVDTIQAGVNFEQKINTELDNSDAVLVLIGNQWLDCKGKAGNRRLDDPHDYVRLEVATALGKNIVVIPILLQGTQMPSGNVLPDTLYDLSRRNAIRLNDDHWNSDCNLLAGVLKNALNISRSLKERKIRRYRVIVFALAALVTLLALLTQSFFAGSFSLIGVLIKILLTLFVVINVALVTYLLGNIRNEELDRLSWTIISIAILGSFLVSFGGSLTIWSAVVMVFLAGLLNFVESGE
jgi:hypothetical protein